MNKIDPKLLQVFADVVDQGSFTGAADVRETNVSYITRQIKKLEAELKALLLNRSTRALSLTETGQQVYQHARQINELMKDVSTIADNQSDQLTGSLRITSAAYIGKKFLFPIIERLCDEHPDINIELQLNDHQVDIIRDRFDMAIRVWKPKSVDLVGQKLLDVRFLLAASPSFIDKHGLPQTIEDLKSLPAIVYARKGHTNKAFNYIDDSGKLRSFDINANLCVNDAEQLNQCIANGKRYYVPTNFMVADKIKNGELIQLLPALNFPAEESIYAVYPNRELSRIAKLLIGELKKDLQQYHMT
ncbi:LysR family transcriptional regulator [Vibrio sp. SCSIO 43137]|uniref:LysR family transcriptional regulator n=1 Tax=Vibrio sp. SCSIO 43137 TaxID=3021011 RepID=UPI0023079FBB|nr:LysR family transcriptional regulator [Vibrio sp. SCSIO 43137]WCE31839.1 LysR substrate-binding domain-containing protein [Vibrio sp. SCSIO 43137]